MSAFGLPSLDALDSSGGLRGPMRIWLCTRRSDMRWGFDRLAALAEEVTGQDPLSGHLFVFRNRVGDRQPYCLHFVNYSFVSGRGLGVVNSFDCGWLYQVRFWLRSAPRRSSSS